MCRVYKGAGQESLAAIMPAGNQAACLMCSLISGSGLAPS